MTTSTDIEGRMAASAMMGTDGLRSVERFVAAGARGVSRWTDLEIETQRGHCTARWHDRADPTVSAPGLGLARGQGFALARSGRADHTQGTVGLVEYVLDAAGGLSARWVHPSLGPQIGSGAAERRNGEPSGFAGSYRIVYRDADGEQAGPVCTLRIQQSEKAYALGWSAGDRPLFEGVGLEAGDVLLAAWGSLGEPCDLVVLRRSNDGGAGLDGRAVSARSTTIDDETYTAAPGA
jgi:hypothetical protein